MNSNNVHHVRLATNSKSTPSVLWKIAIGEGRSQIVGDSTQIYVASGSATKRKGKPDLRTTRISALNPNDGSKTWEHEFQSDMYETQETFGGAKQCPRVTPLVLADRLLAISFTGQLVCLDRRDGRVAWEKDLVKDFGAVPVQFGFTSSPVIDPTSPDRV